MAKLNGHPVGPAPFRHPGDSLASAARTTHWTPCGYCAGRGYLGAMLTPLAIRDCPACEGTGEILSGECPW